MASRRACEAYVTQTLTGWHPGVARAHWARHFLAAAPPLSDKERAAAETIRVALRQAGALLLREVVLGRRVDAPLQAAFETLGARARTLVDGIWEDLLRWQHDLRTPPKWFVEVMEKLDHLFTMRAEAEVRVYLLPSPPDCVAGNGSMFVEHGATSLSCSGASGRDAAPWLTLAHEIAHALHQPRRLDPLLAELLSESSVAREIAQRYRKAPLSAQISLPAYVAELVIHSLVPHGLLAPDEGRQSRAQLDASLPRVTAVAADASWGMLYDAWVTRGALELVPVLDTHLRAGGVIDKRIVLAALSVFDRFMAAWKR